MKIHSTCNMECKFLDALTCILAQVSLNTYTIENIILGRISINDEIPYGQFLIDLGISKLSERLDINCMHGIEVQNGVILSYNLEELLFEIFRDNIDYIFRSTPKFNIDCNYDILQCQCGKFEYLRKQFQIFKDALSINEYPISINTISDIPYADSYYDSVSNLISDIELKKLRIGCCIDKYIGEYNGTSQFVKRLIQVQNNHYYLINDDVNSRDYILAMLSCFKFYSDYNKKLFEHKLINYDLLTRY